MEKKRRLLLVIVVVLLFSVFGWAGAKRKVIIDQDAMGPAGTDIISILVFLQSPQVEPLGITVVSGDGWRDEEVAHTLRLLEIIGRTDIPVVPGAVFPLINSKERAENWEKLYGKLIYMGAWRGAWHVDYPESKYHDPFVVPELKEGSPSLKPANEDAAHFLVRMVRQYPHEVTIYAGGPLTNLALAMALDPEFPELAQELVLMGGSINPHTADPEFANSPQHEFNFWFDPEATHKVLHGHWKKATVTTVDISVKTRMTKAMVDEIAAVRTPAAQYVAKYAYVNDESYMWDELAAAAWLDPTIITKEQMLYMDGEVDQGAGYGNTLTWRPGFNPGLGEQLVHVQQDLDAERFYRLFVQLMTGPTPGAHGTSAQSPGAVPTAKWVYSPSSAIPR